MTEWDNYARAMWKMHPAYCNWEYVIDPIVGGTRLRWILKDFTVPFSTRNAKDGYDYPAPEKDYQKGEVYVSLFEDKHFRHRFADYRGHPNYQQDWADWFFRELRKEKGDNKFRHHAIVIDVKPYMGADVSWNSKSFALTKENIDSSNMNDFQKKRLHELRKSGVFGEDEVVDILGLCLYSAARDRNPIFCRESFTMNEHAWDEIGDLL